MYAIKMSDGGRVVVPVEVRKALHLTEGETLLGELRNGEFVLTTRRQRLRKAQALIAQHCPLKEGESVADELIAERRAEAERE